jgi:hypothetical protein
MYDARFYVFQEGEETGFALDETDSFQSHFILMQPTEFNLDDDGIYEMIFSGRLGFTVPIQTGLLFDTIGGPNDCSRQPPPEGAGAGTGPPGSCTWPHSRLPSHRRLLYTLPSTMALPAPCQ